MRVDILTIFPDMVRSPLSESIPRIAQDKGVLALHCHDIRDYTSNKHGKVDDRPFGGGPGMVLCCQPVVEAVEAVQAMGEAPGRLVFLTPEGRRFDQGVASEFSEAGRLVLVCGRYEGFDQRILDILNPELISIGDFILSGGEAAALVVVDAVTRLLPGVLGSDSSLHRESFTAGLLDCPHYTQPAVYRDRGVPDVLRSGDHARIEAWREAQARARTQALRSDMLPGE